MRTFYVVRRGWNAANQSSMGGKRNPKNTFESGYDCYLGTVEAETAHEAVALAETSWTVYNNQFIHVYTSPRQMKGLTAAINQPEYA